MKQQVHPSDYRKVVYQDEAAGFAFLTRSTIATTETIKWQDGQEYPLAKLHISSASHPFYTGESKVLDVEGRVDRFKAKRQAANQRRQAGSLVNKAKKAAKRAEKKAAKV
ncbi:MAG: type B 50S ribosomal protein L31 [Candidatus Chaera renei]|uniref:Large ribosomal subunit protein bL31B n=1 Tax=Candidatus Chaera renei TaxID=2506947 RepID=A0A4Q0AIJ5_9BACT|nr:MAG: type B 50S ribosomal protein L31 [Candidatus Chaera renei]